MSMKPVTRMNAAARLRLASLNSCCATCQQMLALFTATVIGLGATGPVAQAAPPASTETPIEHLVIVFQENVSFDHYFGTYPNAANPPGEPPFQAADGTPSSLTA